MVLLGERLNGAADYAWKGTATGTASLPLGISTTVKVWLDSRIGVDRIEVLLEDSSSVGTLQASLAYRANISCNVLFRVTEKDTHIPQIVMLSIARLLELEYLSLHSRPPLEQRNRYVSYFMLFGLTSLRLFIYSSKVRFLHQTMALEWKNSLAISVRFDNPKC